MDRKSGHPDNSWNRVTLSRQLVVDYGRSYSEENLRRMVQFAEAFSEEIVVTLSRHLSWSHFSALLPRSQPFQREFYAEMCRIEGWSVRTPTRADRFHALRRKMRRQDSYSPSIVLARVIGILSLHLLSCIDEIPLLSP
jgi:hypothetical protein